MPHMVYLKKAAPVRPRLCTSISVTHPQPHVSTTQVGSHPVRSAPTYKRSASTALAGTHHPVGADLHAGTGPFPKPRALVLPMVIFGQSKPDGLGYIDTVDSDLINTVSLSFSGIQDCPAGTPPILLRRPVESSMRLVFKKPVIVSRTSLISSLHTLATRTSPSCSTRTTSSPTLWFFAFKEDSTSKKYVVYGPTHRSRPAATPFTFWNTDGHILLCTHPQCRGQET